MFSNVRSPDITEIYNTPTFWILANFTIFFFFLQLCCLHLVSSSVETWLQTSQLCRQHDREYTVCFSLSNPWNVLTTQGSHWFSHTVALFTLALSGSHAHPAIFKHAILLQVCQLCKDSRDHGSSGIIKNLDTRKYSHTSNQWISQLTYTHFP